MTDLEALMWRLGGHDPRLVSTMSMLVIFDGPLDRALLRERLAWLSRRVPRLRCRVATSPLRAVPPRWEADPEFSIDRHVQVARWSGPHGDTPGPGSSFPPPELLRIAEDVLASPFPDGRPPWRVVLVPGESDALVLHLHHSYTDGLGGVRLLAGLFDLMASAHDDAQFTPAPTPRSAVTTLAGDIQLALRRSADLARAAVPWSIRSLRVASTDPGPTLEAVSEVARSARSALAGAAGPPSPVLAGRSDAVTLATLAVPVDSLREVGQRLGATLNDVYLAVLLEGLARYHEKCATLPPSLRLAVPMSARPDGDEALVMQNQVQAALLRGPLGPLDFDERVRLVHEMMVLARRQPWLGLVDVTAGVGMRAPGAVRLISAALRSIDVVASNVVGPTSGLTLGGSEALSLVPFGPRAGSALNTTLLSYSKTAHIGLNIDPGAVEDPRAMTDCIAAVIDEHLAPVG